MFENRFIRKHLIFLPLLTLFVGCGGVKTIKQKIDENISCNTMSYSKAPNWVFMPIPRNDQYFYGVGVSDGFDKPFQEMKVGSRSNAEADLSSVIETRVSSSMQADIKVNKTNSGETISKSVKQVMKSNSDLLLSEIYVDEVWFNKDTCQLWTKVKLSRKHLEESKGKIKSMILLEIEKTSDDVSEIKEIVKDDPNLKLRRYGLTIDSYKYIRVFELDLPQEELFDVLDLYKKYGSIPYSQASTLGLLHKEPYKSFLIGIAQNLSYRPDFTMMSLIQALSAQKGVEDILKLTLDYSKKLSSKENSVKFYDSARYDSWFKKSKDELDDKSKELTRLHKKWNDEISYEYSITKDRKKYDKNKSEISGKISKNWDDHKQKHDDFYESSNQLNKRASFNDHLYTVHIAACYGSKKSLRLLSAYGYSMSKKTKQGYLPIEIARYCKNDEAIRHLN